MLKNCRALVRDMLGGSEVFIIEVSWRKVYGVSNLLPNDSIGQWIWGTLSYAQLELHLTPKAHSGPVL